MNKDLEKSHNTITYVVSRLGLTFQKTLSASMLWVNQAVDRYTMKTEAHSQRPADGLKSGFAPRLRPQSKSVLCPEDIAAGLNTRDPHEGAAVVIRSNNPSASHKKPQVLLVENGYIVDTGNRMSFHHLTPEHMYYYGVGSGLLPTARPDMGARRLGERFAQRHGYQETHPSAHVQGQDPGLQMLVCEVLENRHFIIPGKTNSPVAAGNYGGAPSTGQPQGMTFISEKVGQQEFPKVGGENAHAHEALQLKKADPALRPDALPFAPRMAGGENEGPTNVIPMQPRPAGHKPRGPGKGPGRTPRLTR